MLFDLGVIFFVLSLPLSPLSSLIALRLRNYISEKYPQSELLNYIENTIYFRVAKFESIYEKNGLKDNFINKHLAKYKLTVRIGIILFLFSFIIFIIHFYREALKLKENIF